MVDIKHYYEDLEIGQIAEITRKVSERDIDLFAEVSGDYNPLHMDEEYAKTTVFGERIAHGALTASYVSSILGNELPGPGSVFISLSMKFRRPVRIGTEVIAQAEVTDKKPRGNRVTLKVKCVSEGKTLITGEVEVMVPARPDN